MPFKELQERITELERRMSNMLFYGVVIEAKENKVKVAQGDLVTGWIPVFQAAAGTDESIFTPIENGEMVCVVCPNGSIENGAALRGLNYKSKPIPDGADNGVFVLKLADTEIKFTKNSNEIQISGKGNIKVETTGNAEIKAAGAKVEATGEATVKGSTVKIDPSAVCQVGQGAVSGVLTKMNTVCPILGTSPSTGSLKLLSE